MPQQGGFQVVSSLPSGPPVAGYLPLLIAVCTPFLTPPLPSRLPSQDKATGQSLCYGFVQFQDHATATAALAYLRNKQLHGQMMRVNWALGGLQKEDTNHHHHIFVGDLDFAVDDAMLYQAFALLPECS